MLGTGGPVVTAVVELLLITLSNVSEVALALLVSILDAPKSTLTTFVAVELAPAASVLNVHVISVVPAHEPPIASAKTRVVPGGSLSLI